jgi:hypothetical protein
MSTSNTLKFSGPIRVGTLTADPASADNGTIYYNSTSGKMRQYDNGTWQDLAAAVVASNLFRIQDNIDATKQIAFDASAITTATTRTITMPDSNVSLGLIATALQTSQLGVANGVASLDSGGKVPSSQLPSSVTQPGSLNYKGTWDASTAAYPTSPAKGDYYVVSVAGTISGHAYAIHDWLTYNGTAWDYIDNSMYVSSVNGQQGAVVLTTTNINEGTNLYFTNGRAQTAAVENSIVSGHTTIAPSGDSVFTALALKQNAATAVTSVNSVTPSSGNVTLTTTNISEGTNLYFTDTRAQTAAVRNAISSLDTTIAPSGGSVYTALLAKLSSVQQDTSPTLGGHLLLNGKTFAGTMHRSASGTPLNYIEQEYQDFNTLNASATTTTFAGYTFAFATFGAIQINYYIKEATTNRMRKGTLHVVCDGTNVGVTDSYTETADCGVTWTAVISAGNVNVQYTTTANAKTIRSDITRFATL